MNKYYIRFGDVYSKTIIAENTVVACILVFKDYFTKEEKATIMPTLFRISQKGFEDHEDDIFIYTADIIRQICIMIKSLLDSKELVLRCVKNKK